MASELIETVILALSMVFLLTTGAILVIKGQNKNDKAQIWLGVSFFSLLILYIVWGLGLFERYYTVYIIQLFVFIAATFFGKAAFYQNRKSAFPYIMIGTILVGLIQVIQKVFEHHGIFPDFFAQDYYIHIDNLLSILWTAIPFGWMAHAARKARKDLKTQDVEPWILRRLTLIEISAVVEIFVSVPDLIKHAIDVNWDQSMWYLQIAIITTFTVINFFAWAMPSWFKELLNKGKKEKTVAQIESEDETKMSEDAIMQELMEVYQT